MSDAADIPVALVVAVAQNGVIGRDGTLPWRMSDDLKFFKNTTMGNPIIMGRTTFESIGKPLPGRRNIVLSRSDFRADGIETADTPEEALKIARAAAIETGAEEICVIGGAQIYGAFMDMADRIYLTLIKADVAGDTILSLPGDGWDKEVIGTITRDDRNDHDAEIERWERRTS